MTLWCFLSYFLSSELFNLSTCVDGNSFPELNAALTDTVNATQALVTKFVQLSDHRLTELQGGSFAEYQETKNEVMLLDSRCYPILIRQSQVVVLRSEVDLLRGKLRDTEIQRDSYHNALVALENRFERSQSAIVHEVERKGKSQERECEPDMTEEAVRKPPSPLVSGSVLFLWWESIFIYFLHFLTVLLQSSAAGTPIIQNNGYHDMSSEVQVFQDQLKARDAKIMELEKEGAVLRDEKMMMQLEVSVFGWRFRIYLMNFLSV